jgi:hypothetical protein
MFQFSADATIRHPLVEVEQSAESRPAPHAAGPVNRRGVRDQPIVEPLVIPFGMVVLYILRHGAPEVMLPLRNDPVEAFVFDRVVAITRRAVRPTRYARAASRRRSSSVRRSRRVPS